jgi:hypothetical protein
MRADRYDGVAYRKLGHALSDCPYAGGIRHRMRPCAFSVPGFDGPPRESSVNRKARRRCSHGQRERRKASSSAPPRPAAAGALGTDGLIEPVENRRRVDQHLAVVEHERGHAAQRIDRAPASKSANTERVSCSCSNSKTRSDTAARRTWGESYWPTRIIVPWPLTPLVQRSNSHSSR